MQNRFSSLSSLIPNPPVCSGELYFHFSYYLLSIILLKVAFVSRLLLSFYLSFIFKFSFLLLVDRQRLIPPLSKLFYYVKMIYNYMKNFISNTVAADTIPLKLVVYLALLAAVVLLLAHAWSIASPVLQGAEIKAQAESASLSLLSIQGGYARNSEDRHSPEGSMCTLPFSLPPSVRYVSFGVDPDQECNGNLTDSEWTPENNTLIYQYKNGVKKRVFLEGAPVHFIKGIKNSDGIWVPAGSREVNGTFLDLESTAVVIEDPVSGEFLFEMVTYSDTRYTMARF